MRIIANAFRLAHVASRHHIQLAAFLPKPHWSRNLGPDLTERCKRDVFLTANLRWNSSLHHGIVKV